MAPCSSSCPAHIHNLGPSSTFVSGDAPAPSSSAGGSMPASPAWPPSGRGSPAGGAPVLVVSERVVGIDLGTTNSAVAATEGGKPTIVTNAEGQRTMPSVVACPKSGDRLVVQIAKRQAVVNPENTFFSVKRFIGRKMPEVDEESKQVSYRVVRDGKGNVKLECPPSGSSLLPMRFLLRLV